MLTNLINTKIKLDVNTKVKVEYDSWIKKEEAMSQTFGKLIRQARKQKEYSQRELAKLVGVNYTYLSKLENDHAGYPPSEDVIDLLAHHLELSERKDELRRLAGRITPDDAKVFEDLVKKYKQMPALLRRMRDEPKFARELLQKTNQDNEEK